MCVGGSMLVLLFCVPLLWPLAEQFPSMNPGWQALDTADYRAAYAAVSADAGITAVHNAFQAMAGGGDAETLERLRRRDPDNGLYSYLSLLLSMRARGAASSAPAQDGELGQLIARANTGPAVKLYRARYSVGLARKLESRGIDAVRAVMNARSSTEAWPPHHRVILRELSDRLLKQAGHWRAAGRNEEAITASRVVVQLWNGLMSDVPEEHLGSAVRVDPSTPGIALLAAEKLPEALRNVPGGEVAATKAAALAADYHAAAAGEVGIIPWTGDFALAPNTQQRLLSWLTAVLLAAGTWTTLLVMVWVLLPVLLITQPLQVLVPRGRWGGWIGALVVLGPLLVLLIVLLVRPPSFTWLFSLPTLPVAALSPVLVVAMLGLASRFFIIVGPAPSEGGRPPRGLAATAERQTEGAFAEWRPPIWLVIGLVGIVVLVFVTSAVLILRGHGDPWRPPVGVRLLRGAGWLTEVACLPAVAAWWVAGQWLRRRAGVGAGTLSRANVRIASRALLICSILLLSCALAANHAASEHREAFLKAVSDPVEARLGSDWHAKYFGPARELLTGR